MSTDRTHGMEEIRPKTLEDVSRQLTFLEKKLDLLMQCVFVEKDKCSVHDLWVRGGKNVSEVEK